MTIYLIFGELGIEIAFRIHTVFELFVRFDFEDLRKRKEKENKILKNFYCD